MSNTFAIASSGLHAAQQRLNASAHNIANLGTDGMHRLRVDQTEAPATGGVLATTEREPEPGVSLQQEMLAQHDVTYSFQANLKTIKAQDALLGTLLDEHA